MNREELIEKIKEGNLSKEEELALIDEFMGKKKKTPVQLEVIKVWDAIKKNDEVREVGVKLISKLKSEMEGRGVVPKEELDRRRKVFWTMVSAVSED